MEEHLFIMLCLCLVKSVLMSNNKRLLLNDPAAIMSRLDHLESRLQQQELEIRQLRNSINDTKPAFFAVLSVGGVDIGSDQIVKFDSVKTNIGGGYDPFTGVFIAPNPGTFQFVSVIYSNGNDDVEAQMNKNNEVLLRGYSSAASHAESHVMNAVVNLQQGDHIYIRHRESKAQHVRGALHSSFSGFQII